MKTYFEKDAKGVVDRMRKCLDGDAVYLVVLGVPSFHKLQVSRAWEDSRRPNDKIVIDAPLPRISQRAEPAECKKKLEKLANLHGTLGADFAIIVA